MMIKMGIIFFTPFSIMSAIHLPIVHFTIAIKTKNSRKLFIFMQH